MNVEILNQEEVNPPKINFSKYVRHKIQFIVDNCDTEIGFLGFCKLSDDGVIHVTDVFIPKQLVNSVTCELKGDALTDMMEIWSETYKDSNKVNDMLNSILFWGHSHVNMSTNPSQQDDDEIMNFANKGKDFYIRGIFNKRGESNITFYDFKNNLKWSNLPFDDYYELDEDDKDMILGDIQLNLENKTYNKYNYDDTKTEDNFDLKESCFH